MTECTVPLQRALTVAERLRDRIVVLGSDPNGLSEHLIVLADAVTKLRRELTRVTERELTVTENLLKRIRELEDENDQLKRRCVDHAKSLLLLHGELDGLRSLLPQVINCFKGCATKCGASDGLTCCQLKIRMIGAGLLAPQTRHHPSRS